MANIDLDNPHPGQEILNIFLNKQGILKFNKIGNKNTKSKIKKIINLLLFLVN